MMYGLRANIAKNAPNIKLLASIGGWNMGGSSSGKPNIPKPPQAPAWAALLKDPQNLADAMSAIVGIKAQLPQPPESTGKVVSLYDGIDIDMETLYAAGCTGDNNTCSLADEQKTITNTAAAIAIFRKAHPNTILSISPRAADIYCEASSCSWHDSTGYGFIGKILKKLADQHVYFNYINPQFYNDNGARNVPNNTSSLSNPQPTYSSPSIGAQVATILSKLQGIVGSNSEINIGVLAQTDDHWIDSGGSSMSNNPGVPKSQVKNLWNLLQTDPDIKASGATISGLMTWAANLSFTGGLPGHVRSKTSTNNVPYNWGNISTAQPLHPQSAVVHKQSLWSKLISKVEGLF